jgi:hypothetical protein
VIAASLVLVAQAMSPFCASVKDVVHSATADFQRIRGTKHEDNSKRVLWTDPVKVSGARSCTVLEQESLLPVYACAIDVETPCAQMQEAFANLTRELELCLEKSPKLTEGKVESSAAFHPSEVSVVLSYLHAKQCSIAIEIEPPEWRYNDRFPGPSATINGPMR